MRNEIPRLYAILDPAQTGGRAAEEVLDALLEAGVHLIQYRDKRSTVRDVFAACRRLAERARGSGCRFIVNDRADLAVAAGADGVHVGQDDLPVEMARRVVGPVRWVGYSTHDLAQVREADSSSANYIAFGPIFATQSKEKPDPVVGLDGLRQARKATAKPLVAIGGITLENARSVLEAGADSVAVIRGLLAAPDIAAQARLFSAQVESAGAEGSV